MARCGCGGVCSCAVRGCDDGNTTVTGSGTRDDPYIVCAQRTPFSAEDTDSVDITLAGNGTPDSPYNLRADVRIDPLSGGLLTITENGLLVSCEAVQDCIGIAAGNGQGIVYVDNADDLGATGELSVCLSQDAGNELTFGADGCLFVSAVAMGGVQSLTPDCLDVQNGTDLSLIVPDDCNGLVCGPDGLRAPPERFMVAAGLGLPGGGPPSQIPTGTAVAPGTTFSAPQACFDITNPDDCRPANVHFQIGHQFEFEVNGALGAVANVQIGSTQTIDGVAGGGPQIRRENVTRDIGGGNDIYTWTEERDFHFQIPAGATIQVCYTAQIRNNGPATVTTTATVNGAAGRYRLWSA